MIDTPVIIENSVEPTAEQLNQSNGAELLAEFFAARRRIINSFTIIENNELRATHDHDRSVVISKFDAAGKLTTKSEVDDGDEGDVATVDEDSLSRSLLTLGAFNNAAYETGSPSVKISSDSSLIGQDFIAASSATLPITAGPRSITSAEFASATSSSSTQYALGDA